MNSLFGLSMNTIMIWMLSIFLIVTAVVAVLALRNKLFFKMGLRNIPRRRAQTVLIIVGLMLSTVIITSAFSTGDTVSYSIRNATIQNLGFIDESVTGAAANQAASVAGGVAYIPAPVQARILGSLAANHNVDGYTAILARNAALQDVTSGQTKNQNVLAGIPTNVPSAFGPLVAKDGSVVTIGQLGANQVYLNQKAAGDLNAQPGDRILVYVGNQPVAARVQAILQNQNLASGGLLSNGQLAQPTVIAPIGWVRTVIGQPSAVTQILISNRGGLTSGESLSDGVTNLLRAQLANTSVVAQVQSLLVTPAGKAALTKAISGESNTTVKNKLKSLQAQVVAAGQSDQLKSLLSDSDVTDALANMKAPATLSAPLNNALASISDYHVEPLKKNGLDAADLFGSVFTSIFVVFGLFSIAAGVMLIFLIFVMLAAERRPEMGMARAVGTQRRHLIQQFLFEGYTYDLGSAVVGVILGVAVGLGMVRILTAVINNASSDFSLTGHVEPRSLVVAFCLGALVTFITVAVSSVRVSRLNVVAAIRDLPEQFGVKTHAGHAWEQTKAEFVAVRRSKLRIIFWLVALPMFLIPLLGITYLVLRVLWYLRHLFLAFLARGPLFLIAGILILLLGLSTKQQGFFSLGGSLLIIGAAMLARWIMQGAHVPDPIRNRIGYSAAGLGLVVFWLLPFDFWSNVGVPTLNAGPEMFFLSGLMMVLGAVWTVMYNIDVLLGALLAVFGGIGHLAPMIKMAVTYPTQHKFRTGLTLSMFSLVIFTLMFMSVLVGSSSSTLVMNRDTGGYQIYGAVNPNNPILNAPAQVAANPNLKGITAVGGMANLNVGVRQPGQDTQNWQDYFANVLDDSYLNTTKFTLHSRANGFGADAQVWQALKDHPGYAVVDSGIIASDSSSGSNNGGFALKNLYYKDATFRPVVIQVRDNRTGAIFSLRVIGVLDRRSAVLPNLTAGIYTGERTLTAAGLPAVQPNLFVFRVAPGVDVHATALALGKAFLRNGLDVKESQKEFNSNEAVANGLFDLLEGFMGLGLIVGIAALGVVATRSVVERRQEIGMMRAIGFQRAMVRTTFLLESSFVAILGTVLGLGLGLGLARNLVNFEAKTDNSITLQVPWTQIGIIVLVAYLASLLTTYLPAWQASRVYPAEALRYE